MAYGLLDIGKNPKARWAWHATICRRASFASQRVTDHFTVGFKTLAAGMSASDSA